MKPEEVTEQILGAWDEVEPSEEPAEGAPDEDTDEAVESEDDTPLEPGADDAEPEEDTEEGEDDAPAEEEEEEQVGEGDEDEEAEVKAELETATVTLPDDPFFRQWLARYQGDVQKALEGAYQLEKVLGRQGQEKAVLSRRVKELESQLTEITAFQSEPVVLNAEQQSWIGEAVESGNPAAYVREAVRAGEFALARAVCSEWGRESPYDAMRAGQVIDAAESRFFEAAQVENVEPVNMNAMLDVLVEHFPDMPQYEAQMVETINRLGPMNHNVIDAHSPDPETAARGIINLYEIARSSAATVAQTKRELRNGHREAATGKRRAAVVSSAEASPTPGETPRSVRLGPGLTLAALEEEWEANS